MEQSDISSSPLTVHTNLWLETNDKVVLSRWRVQLLEAIGETGSIRAAATRMKITYHLAWHRLDEMETAIGTRLVERQRGGPKGGSAQLTAAGHDYVARTSIVSRPRWTQSSRASLMKPSVRGSESPQFSRFALTAQSV